MSFAGVYPHYIAKAEKKGRTKEEVDTIINNPETLPDAYASLLQSKSVYAFQVGLIYRERT